MSGYVTQYERNKFGLGNYTLTPETYQFIKSSRRPQNSFSARKTRRIRPSAPTYSAVVQPIVQPAFVDLPPKQFKLGINKKKQFVQPALVDLPPKPSVVVPTPVVRLPTPVVLPTVPKTSTVKPTATVKPNMKTYRDPFSNLTQDEKTTLEQIARKTFTDGNSDVVINGENLNKRVISSPEITPSTDPSKIETLPIETTHGMRYIKRLKQPLPTIWQNEIVDLVKRYCSHSIVLLLIIFAVAVVATHDVHLQGFLLPILERILPASWFQWCYDNGAKVIGYIIFAPTALLCFVNTDMKSSLVKLSPFGMYALIYLMPPLQWIEYLGIIVAFNVVIFCRNEARPISILILIALTIFGYYDSLVEHGDFHWPQTNSTSTRKK